MLHFIGTRELAGDLRLNTNMTITWDPWLKEWEERRKKDAIVGSEKKGKNLRNKSLPRALWLIISILECQFPFASINGKSEVALQCSDFNFTGM